MSQYIVISRGMASGARGGGVKTLRLRSDFTPRLADAEAQQKHIELSEKAFAWVAEVIEQNEKE